MSIKILVGEMNREVKIQRLGHTRNDYGEMTETWTTTYTVWAKIEPVNAKEYFDSNQTKAEVVHRMITRYININTGQWRTVYAGRNFDIESVLNIMEQNEFIEMICREQVK